eukprot:TRINITY_DN7008_c0_g1_i1.p1 TRINITY_DN7008_c0_g1~~TRINITY_DN7008_c0_g1_i1.p1  ORF type:complete len:176 (+),score=39.05 TRINITY_DN7008_c0_g1_i1:107-634(+)
MEDDGEIIIIRKTHATKKKYASEDPKLESASVDIPYAKGQNVPQEYFEAIFRYSKTTNSSFFPKLNEIIPSIFGKQRCIAFLDEHLYFCHIFKDKFTINRIFNFKRLFRIAFEYRKTEALMTLYFFNEDFNPLIPPVVKTCMVLNPVSHEFVGAIYEKYSFLGYKLPKIEEFSHT